MRIAWFSPFSIQSAIGKYSGIIVRSLTPAHQVTVFSTDLTDRSKAIFPDADIQFIDAKSRPELIRSLDEFDAIIYNLGNYPKYHASIFEIAVEKPGIVILHDAVMHHFFWEYYLEWKNDPQGYLNALNYSHGEEGLFLAREVVQGKMQHIFQSSAMLKYNTARSALGNPYGVIVHSSFAQQIIESFAAYPVVHIDFPTPEIGGKVAQQMGTQSQMLREDGKIYLLTYGRINSNRCVGQVIEVLALNPTLSQRVVYNIIGTIETQEEEHLRDLIRRHHMEDQVHLHGYQPDSYLYDQLQHSDVIVNLRNPHFGESSWTLLEAAVFGKPTVVWKHGSYNEFPDDCVVKVSDNVSLRTALEHLVADEKYRQALGTSILAYAQRTFTTERYCTQLLEFIEQVKYNAVYLDLVDYIGFRLHEVLTPKDDTNLVNHLSKELATLVAES